MIYISKELFVEDINNILKQQKICSEFSDALSKVCDGWVIYDTNNLYLNSLIKTLEALTNDNANYITWWLWEDVPKIIYDENGEEVIAELKTPENLYDFLSAQSMKNTSIR